MEFSLVVATLNRPKELRKCIISLLNQSYRNFEIIIIDQSDNNETQQIIESIDTRIPIKYKRVDYKALSKARNDALKIVEGNYVCLIDDDAVYTKDYLARAYDYLRSTTKKVILSGVIIGIESGKEFVKYKIAKDKENLKIRKILKICQSAGLIIPFKFLQNNNGFDINFGVGARYGSSEETDVLIKAKEEEYQIIHLKKLILFHPIKSPDYDENYYKKIFSYAKGGGALIKKHMIYNKKFFLFTKMLNLSIGQIIKMYLSLDSNKRKEYKVKLTGFFYGFKDYKNISTQ